MPRGILRLTILGALSLALAACSADRAVTPAAAGPSFLIGDVPTNHLVAVSGVAYVPGEGLNLSMSVNRGLLRAARAGRTTLMLRVTLTLTDAAGNGIIVVDGCPLADIKVDLADPRPDPLPEFTFGVPWDGKDSDGNAMTGMVTVAYSAGVVFEPNGEPIVLGPGPVTGTLEVFVPPVIP